MHSTCIEPNNGNHLMAIVTDYEFIFCDSHIADTQLEKCYKCTPCMA